MGKKQIFGSLSLTIERLTLYAYFLLFMVLNAAHGEFWEVQVGQGILIRNTFEANYTDFL